MIYHHVHRSQRQKREKKAAAEWHDLSNIINLKEEFCFLPTLISVVVDNDASLFVDETNDG